MRLAVGDIVIVSPFGQVVAVVEVKNGPATTPALAAALRRNALMHGGADAAFFLLLSQTEGFLWDQRVQSSPDAAPTARFPMAPVVERFVPRERADERLWGRELELIVFQWLNELAEGLADAEREPERMLARSGLLPAVREASIHFAADS
jgi:hypothetical protein